MSDSSEHDEIFGDDSEASDNSLAERTNADDPAPEYVNSDEFQQFVKANNINVN